jgi:hypothetical protein
VKKNICIFGVGHYGKNAYWNLNKQYNIVSFIDNNKEAQGGLYDGIKIISLDELILYDMMDTDIIVCTRDYLSIGKQLLEIGIESYYVMLEGFLYYTNLESMMVPVELNNSLYLKKNKNEKNILFVQNSACIRTHRFAILMRDRGYNVYLLYTMAPPVNAYEQFNKVYKGIWGFTSYNGILNFINNSDFDIIHCSNEPDILVNIVKKSNKPVIADTHDMQSIRADIDINAIVLEYLANTKSNGNIYVSNAVASIAHKKYGDNKNTFCIENLVMDQYEINEAKRKKSTKDGEIHCVYEGGIVGNSPQNHRYFDVMWKKIAELGIHIHFFSPSNLELCKRLENLSPYIHYEGSASGGELISKMTEYDCGLALFNSNYNNKFHLESTSINKVYEYINARLPIISYGIDSLNNFVEKYKVGVNLDFNKNIKEQIETACKIIIPTNFLRDNKMTMNSFAEKLENFYNMISNERLY